MVIRLESLVRVSELLFESLALSVWPLFFLLSALSGLENVNENFSQIFLFSIYCVLIAYLPRKLETGLRFSSS